MDGGDNEPNYAGALAEVTEGEWAGWNWYPGGDPFEDAAGPFYWKFDADGRRRCAFRAQERHMNGGRFMHGGCLMTFADYSLFVEAHEAIKDSHAVTASFNADFLGKVQVGDLLEATAEVVKAGRSLVFLRGMIATGGAPVMSFSAVLKITGPRTG